MTAKTRIRLRVVGELLIVALLIGWLLANLNRYINTPIVHNGIMSFLSGPYNGKIKAGLLNVHIKEFSAEGWNVSVEDDLGRNMGKSPHVKVWIKFSNIFSRLVRLERMELEKPVVHLWTDPDHVFIIKRWKHPPRKVNSFLHTRVGTVIARDGTFIYDYYPEPKPLHLYLEGINGLAYFTDKTPDIQATINRLYLKYKFFNDVDWFYNLTAKGVIGHDFVIAHRVTATYLNLPLDISGRLDGTRTYNPRRDGRRRKNPRLDLRLLTFGKIGDLLRYFRYNDMPPGEFTLDAKITGLSDDYSVDGAFTSSYGIIKKRRYDNLRAGFVFHRRVVNVEKFNLRMYGMPLEGSGWYNISTGEFHAHAVMIHKKRPIRVAAVGRFDKQNKTIAFTSLKLDSGSARLDLSGTWFISKGTLKFKYRLVIRNLAKELAHWGTHNFAGKLDIKGKFDGPIMNPLVTADGKVSNLEWCGVLFGSHPFSALLKNGDLSTKMDICIKSQCVEASIRAPVLRHGHFINMKKESFSYGIKRSGSSTAEQPMATSLTPAEDTSEEASDGVVEEGAIDNLCIIGDSIFSILRRFQQSGPNDRGQ